MMNWTKLFSANISIYNFFYHKKTFNCKLKS
jgi:hypothetical protein